MSYFQKELLAWIGCFGLFSKIKNGSGTSFWYPFSAYYFNKSFHYVILYQLTKFLYQTFFPSRDIKKFMCFLILFSQWRHKLWDLSSMIFLSNDWLEKNEGSIEIQKIKYLQNEKSFLDQIKSIFHYCHYLVKKEKQPHALTPSLFLQY